MVPEGAVPGAGGLGGHAYSSAGVGTVPLQFLVCGGAANGGRLGSGVVPCCVLWPSQVVVLPVHGGLWSRRVG